MLESVVSSVDHHMAIKSLRRGHTTTFVATGDSMSPLIPPGTKLTILPTKFSQIKVYDIVAAEINHRLVVHQCLFKSKKYLVCYGLHNHFVDPPISPPHTVGIVKTTTPWSLLQLAYHTQINHVASVFKKPIIILKGAPLQKKLFGYYLNKPSSDIDILVTKKDFPHLQNILQNLGYTQASLHQNETAYVKNGLNIDIHFQAVRTKTKSGFTLLSSQFNSDLYRHTQKVANHLYFLDPTYQLLYLCLNVFFHHGFRGLNSYSYISRIVDTLAIDWKTFWRLAQKYHVSAITFYCLVWSSKFFGIKIPQLSNHRPDLPKRLVHKIFINQSRILKPFILASPLQNKLNSLNIILLRLILRD